MSLKEKIKNTIKSVSNFHKPGDRPNVFLFSTPRSGSTWLMELINTQPSFKHCDEPLNLNNALIRKKLDIKYWDGLLNNINHQILEDYFKGYIEGKNHTRNPNPFAGNYKPITSRIIFKILHGCEENLEWFKKQFGGNIVFMIRHPIAVTLSRKQHPRLECFINSEYYKKHLSVKQLSYAKNIFETGTFFEKGIVDWCFQNYFPLKNVSKNILVTYEQLVVNPEPVVSTICKGLTLPKPNYILKRLNSPSGSTRQSDSSTKNQLYKLTVDRKWLINKWVDKVDNDKKDFADHALSLFNIHIYNAHSSMPSTGYLLNMERSNNDRY